MSSFVTRVSTDANYIITKIIAVILFYCLLSYYVFWGPFIYSNKLIAPALLIAMLSLIFINLISSQRKIVFIKEYKILLIFTTYIIISGIFISKELSALIDSLLDWFQIIFLLYFIQFMTINLNIKVKKLIVVYLYILICYFIYFSLIFDSSTNFRMVASENYNPNSIGYMLVIAVWIILYYFNDYKLMITKLFLLALVVWGILFTMEIGSRQTFINLIIIIGIYTLMFLFSNKRINLKIIMYSVFICIIGTLFLSKIIEYIFKFITNFNDSNLYSRFFTDMASAGDNQRKELISQTFFFFSDNPLFGIGFDQFRVLSYTGGYSHSLYLELIATTGLIGLLIFFIFISTVLKRVITNYKYVNKIKTSQIIILILVIMILGITTVHLYKVELMIILFLILLLLRENKESWDLLEKKGNDIG